MATGASTADLAVILIDARLGIQTQSKRHAFIVSLLGVPRVVVGGQQDGPGRLRRRRCSSAFATSTAPSPRACGFADLTFIPISALARRQRRRRAASACRGSTGLPLLPHLETVYIAGDANLIDFRFPVQRVVRPGPGLPRLRGQVVSGIARPGDEVVVLPSGQRTRVTRIVELRAATCDMRLPAAVGDAVPRRRRRREPRRPHRASEQRAARRARDRGDGGVDGRRAAGRGTRLPGQAHDAHGEGDVQRDRLPRESGHAAARAGARHSS